RRESGNVGEQYRDLGAADLAFVGGSPSKRTFDDLVDDRRGVIALHARADLSLFFDLLGELRALDRHGRKIREGGQQIEVLFRKAANVDPGVDLHSADDAIAIPEWNAHRRSDSVDGDRFSA